MFSPALFNIYMKHLGEVIHQFGAQCHHYTEVTQLYISGLSCAGETVDKLTQCLKTVWCRGHGKDFNSILTKLSGYGCLAPWDLGHFHHWLYGEKYFLILD